MAETGQDQLVNKNDQQEGPVARTIESQTAKISSDVFLWAALGSMGASLTLKCLGRKHDALFVGQWAAPFLLLGIYNKIVKVAGHEKHDSLHNANLAPVED